jgi:integrase/recombinase XerD
MKITILYLLNKNKINKMDKCPIRCRITYNNTRKEFATGLFVNPEYWNSKKQKVLDNTEQSDYLNKQLSLIKTKINKVFLLLQVQEQSFDVEAIYRLFKGEKTVKDYNVIEYFERFLERLKTLIDVEIQLSTWYKFFYIKNSLKSFIKWQFKTSDIPLKNLKPQFLVDLDYYLKVIRNKKQITINKEIQRFRKSIKFALAEGYLDRDPFMLYKSKRVKSDVIFLTTEELKRLEAFKFSQLRLQLVKDWFIFSCYTGLAYNELKRFSKQHIVKGFDGALWIQMTRQKTQKQISIPILPKAQGLIDAYITDNAELIFPVLSNQHYNSYLKEIAGIVGINKRLTTHTARKTFASTVLLYNDVPMEIVSELLGHSNMAITQAHYGKVVQNKVSEEMKRLNRKLSP